MDELTVSPAEGQATALPALEFEVGIHPGIPAEVYHASPFISNSQLKKWREHGPHKWNWLRDHPQPEEDTDAKKRGKIFHIAVFEPHLYGEGKSHHVKPKGMSFAKKDGIAWKADHSDGRPILTFDEHVCILGAACALSVDEVVGPMLKAKCLREATAMAIHPETGLRLKMRTDLLTEDSQGRPWVLDTKTIDTLAMFPKHARDFSYDVQATFYPDVLEYLGVHDARFLFAVVELEPPFEIRLETMTPGTILRARELYEGNLREIARCQAADMWPRKYPGIGELNISSRWTEQREEAYAA